MIRVKKCCDDNNVDFIATPFDEPSLDFLVRLKSAALKVASFDLGNLPFLQLIAHSGLPVVISCGGGNSEHRIDDARALRRGTLANKIPYCTNMSTAYSFLEAIKSLKTKKLVVKSLQDN